MIRRSTRTRDYPWGRRILWRWGAGQGRIEFRVADRRFSSSCDRALLLLLLLLHVRCSCSVVSVALRRIFGALVRADAPSAGGWSTGGASATPTPIPTALHVFMLIFGTPQRCVHYPQPFFSHNFSSFSKKHPKQKIKINKSNSNKQIHSSPFNPKPSA